LAGGDALDLEAADRLGHAADLEAGGPGLAINENAGFSCGRLARFRLGDGGGRHGQISDGKRGTKKPRCWRGWRYLRPARERHRSRWERRRRRTVLIVLVMAAVMGCDGMAVNAGPARWRGGGKHAWPVAQPSARRG